MAQENRKERKKMRKRKNFGFWIFVSKEWTKYKSIILHLQPFYPTFFFMSCNKIITNWLVTELFLYIYI